MDRRSCQHISRRMRHPRPSLDLPVVIREHEKFVPFFQSPSPPCFLGSSAASGCGKEGVPAGNTGSVWGEARGVRANRSAWSPKGRRVQQPQEHCKEKSKCDLIKPGISIYLDGLQSVSGFRLIAVLVRKHRANALSTFLSFSIFFFRLPFNLGN